MLFHIHNALPQMANHFQLVVPLVFLFSIAVSLPAVAHAASDINFTFPSQKSLVDLKGDAYTSNQGNAIQLTRSRYTAGWAIYNKSIPLWNTSSHANANFSTHFQFKMKAVNNTAGADGLAFFLAPFDFEPYEYKALFGLFDGEMNKNRSCQVVAVEFDTYRDSLFDPYSNQFFYFDPDNNHVGIDLNDVISNASISLRNLDDPFVDRTLNDGGYWDAWVDYSGEKEKLQVFLLPNPSGVGSNISKPEKPILTRHDLVLSDFLPENIKVGLSASTWLGQEEHSVFSWDFSFKYPWEIENPTESPPRQIETSTASPPRQTEIPTASPANNAPHGSGSVKVIFISVLASLVGLVGLLLIV